MRIRVLSVVVCVFALAGLLTAQVTSRLTGSVIDPTGLPIAGATVDVFLPAGAQPILSTMTSTDGIYAFTGVPSGTYDVIVSGKGFRKFNQHGVNLEAGKELSL